MTQHQRPAEEIRADARRAFDSLYTPDGRYPTAAEIGRRLGICRSHATKLLADLIADGSLPPRPPRSRAFNGMPSRPPQGPPAMERPRRKARDPKRARDSLAEWQRIVRHLIHPPE